MNKKKKIFILILVLGLLLLVVSKKNFKENNNNIVESIGEHCNNDSCQLNNKDQENVLHAIEGKWRLTENIYIVSSILDREYSGVFHPDEYELEEINKILNFFTTYGNIFEIYDSKFIYNENTYDIEEGKYLVNGGQYNQGGNQVSVDIKGNDVSLDEDIINMYIQIKDNKYIFSLGVGVLSENKIVLHIHSKGAPNYYIIECERQV